MNHAWIGLRERLKWRPMPKTAAVLLTFLVVVLAWVPFRAGTFELRTAGDPGAAWKATTSIYGSMFGAHGWEGWPEKKMAVVKSSPAWRSVLIALAIAWVMPSTQRFMGGYSPHYGGIEWTAASRRWWGWRPTWPWMLFSLLLFYAVLSDLDKVSEFIYFHF
ncbi:MAG: hypothetical protein WC661_14740 [Opitutaceae bacterium]